MKPLDPSILNIGPTGSNRLRQIAGFGSNPGALRAWQYVPPGLRRSAPLVVVLHGCTQSAADYDTGAGWSQLADELGFAVLCPEQQRANNPNICFNWFSPIDSRRDSGEALSIRQMMAWMAETHDIDPQRVFVTGLSAGGAMTSIMLATYPEVFAGGAIIAGLPFGAVASVSDAFARMAGQGYPAGPELAALVQRASPHEGPWPVISVWQGSADATVSPSNADRIIAQWRSLHGAGAVETERSGGHTRHVWRNHAAQAVLEQHIIAGMGHGTPLQTRGPDACGKAGPYMLEVGISSTRAIAQFWGLAKAHGVHRRATADTKVAMTAPSPSAAPSPTPTPAPAPAAASVVNSTLERIPAAVRSKGVGGIIEDALRAAGLMK